MIKFTVKSLVIISLFSTFILAIEVPKYNGYENITYNNSKNVILGGATTATAKGYSALSSNPAGLSTNYNATVYLKTIVGSATVIYQNTENKYDIDAGEHIAIGVLYDSFAVEYKNGNYLSAGGAYGYEHQYGLFSIGASYTLDQTDLNGNDIEKGNKIDKIASATGNYLTWGVMWQKTFIDEDDFYAIYVGYSYKNSGRADAIKDSNIVFTSPSKRKMGIGLETNLFDTSVLLTYDIVNEFWQTSKVREDMSGTAYGVKWMVGHKFSIGTGIYNQTYNNSKLQDSKTTSVGIEWGFLGMHLMPSFTKRVTNYDVGSFEDEAIHLDLAFTF